MREGTDLPMADDISQGIQTFEELRELVGNLFLINNIAIVLPPKWEYDFFRHG